MAEIAEIISEFGASAKGKLANAAVTGAPEDQLRAPLETLVLQLAELAGHRTGTVKLVGETTLAHLSSGRTTPSRSATRSPASSRSRHPARDSIHAGSRTSMTRSSGRS